MQGQPHRLRLCASGDARAWRAIVDEHAGLVYAIARAHGLTEDRCDDVAQTVFAALWKSIGTLASDAVLVNWLRTTTTRACWRAVRDARRADASMHADGPGTEHLASTDGPSDELVSAIEQPTPFGVPSRSWAGASKPCSRPSSCAMPVRMTNS